MNERSLKNPDGFNDKAHCNRRCTKIHSILFKLYYLVETEGTVRLINWSTLTLYSAVGIATLHGNHFFGLIRNFRHISADSIPSLSEVGRVWKALCWTLWCCYGFTLKWTVYNACIIYLLIHLFIVIRITWQIQNEIKVLFYFENRLIFALKNIRLPNNSSIFGTRNLKSDTFPINTCKSTHMLLHDFKLSWE